MRFSIINTLYEELDEAVGEMSDYEPSEKVGYIGRGTLPDTLAGFNNVINITCTAQDAGEYEIGQNFSAFFSYPVEIAIMVKGTSNLDAEQMVDKLETRVRKALMNSRVLTLVETSDELEEKVIQFKLLGAEYQNRFPNSSFLFGITMKLQVTTQSQNV